MGTPVNRRTRRRNSAAWCAGLVSLSLVAAACGSDKAAVEPTPEVTTAEAPATTTAPVTEPADSAPVDTSPDPTVATTALDTAAVGPSAIFPTLGPPTGEEIVIGLVNTEGTPGLDFPDIRIDIQAAVDYVNQHGGMGGRPIRIENCTAKGSPETSQACAQEMAGKQVELVMLGLDLFPDYATYAAADIPVIGILPILPGDYSADALFLTGGNATITGAIAAVAKDHFRAKTVGIVGSDNPGSSGSEALLTAALDIAGIAHVTVKGGDNETDAGYEGLVREAAKDDPDLLVSLYSDAGCIGMIRGRASLGITIPVITTAICSSGDVLDEVGDDAVGWSFVGASTQEETPESAILAEVLAPALGVAPEDVDSASLGLGGLGLLGIMSLAEYANLIAGQGDEVTGASLYAYLGSSTGLRLWPGGAEMECGAAPKYPSICSFTLPVSEYLAGGSVVTIEGLEAVSAKPYLP